MANKKNKKRSHSRTVDLKRQEEQEKLARERGKDRWNPTGRALLYCDLVLMALAVLLESNGVITTQVGAVCTVVGVVLLLAALWLLFGPKGGGTRL